MAQRIAQVGPNDEVGGSSPSAGSMVHWNKVMNVRKRGSGFETLDGEGIYWLDSEERLATRYLEMMAGYTTHLNEVIECYVCHKQMPRHQFSDEYYTGRFNEWTCGKTCYDSLFHPCGDCGELVRNIYKVCHICHKHKQSYNLHYVTMASRIGRSGRWVNRIDDPSNQPWVILGTPHTTHGFNSPDIILFAVRPRLSHEVAATVTIQRRPQYYKDWVIREVMELRDNGKTYWKEICTLRFPHAGDVINATGLRDAMNGQV